MRLHSKSTIVYGIYAVGDLIVVVCARTVGASISCTSSMTLPGRYFIECSHRGLSYQNKRTRAHAFILKTALN